MNDTPDPRSDCGSYYIGVDVGTGSVRALVIDGQGRSIASAVEVISEWQPRPSIHLQSTRDIWTSVSRAVKEALRRSEAEPHSVRSIAFVATCSLAVFTHDTNEPVAVGCDVVSSDKDQNVILWKDQRADLETVAINRTRHELLKYLGGSVSILMELPKILWLKQHMSESSFQRCRFYDLHDALAFLATGNQIAPCTEACARDVVPIGVDGTAKGWNRDFLEAVGLGMLAADEYKRIGGVCRHGRAPPAGTFIAQLSAEAAQSLGLEIDVKVGVGTIDAYSGWVGTVGMKFEGETSSPLHSRMAVVAGTSACYIVASQKPIFVDGIWGPYHDWVIPGYWMSEGGQVATGMLLQHIVEIHPAYNEASKSALSLGISIFDYLDRHLENMRLANHAPDVAYVARHYFYYGDLYGNRSPISDASMAGSVAGLTADKTVDSLAIQYYGALEFIAFQMRQVILQMNQAGTEINSLFMSGSVVNNAGLLKLIATCCDMPVVIPTNASTSVSFGAAILAVKANTESFTDGNTDLWSIMQRLGGTGHVQLPEQNPFLRDLLDAKYIVYLEQCERQRVFRSMIDETIAKHTDSFPPRSTGNAS